MAKYAVVANNVITNIVELDDVSTWAPPDGSTAYPLGSIVCSIGWNWNNGVPTNPNPPPAGPPLPDFSNIDNLDKTLKALGLLLRDYTNALQAGTYTTKSVAQLKTDFAMKYNSLL